jgi:hypothetical protein
VFINWHRILVAELGEEGEQKYGRGDPKNYVGREVFGDSGPS